jgi:hypothetical protein
MTDKNTQSTAALLINLEAHNVDRLAAIAVADDIAAKLDTCAAGTVESLHIIAGVESAEWARIYGWQAVATFYVSGDYTKAKYDASTRDLIALAEGILNGAGEKTVKKQCRIGASVGIAMRQRCKGDISKLRGVLAKAFTKFPAFAEYTAETVYQSQQKTPLHELIALLVRQYDTVKTVGDNKITIPATFVALGKAFNFDAKTGASNYKGYIRASSGKAPASVTGTETEEGGAPSGDEVTQGDKEGLTPAMCRTALLELIKQYDVNVAYDELSRVYRELTMARERAQADADEASAKAAATAAKRAARKLATAAA